MSIEKERELGINLLVKWLFSQGLFEEYLEEFNNFHRWSFKTPKDLKDEYFSKRNITYTNLRVYGFESMYISFLWSSTKRGSNFWAINNKLFINYIRTFDCLFLFHQQTKKWL